MAIRLIKPESIIAMALDLTWSLSF